MQESRISLGGLRWNGPVEIRLHKSTCDCCETPLGIGFRRLTAFSFQRSTVSYWNSACALGCVQARLVGLGLDDVWLPARLIAPPAPRCLVRTEVRTPLGVAGSDDLRSQELRSQTQAVLGVVSSRGSSPVPRGG